MNAVIFDMDGVLVDSERQWELAQEPIFRKLIPDWREEDHQDVVGLGVQDLYRFLVEKHGLKEPKDRFLALCDKIAEEVYLKRISRAEGLLELINDLRKHRIRTAVASSSPKKWIQMVLDRFDLNHQFQCVVSVDDVGGQGKPSPAVYLHTAKQLGLTPQQCVAIEDSAHGIQAAKRAGMYCVGLRNGNNQAQDMALIDLEIHSLKELSYGRLNHLAPEKKIDPKHRHGGA